MNSTLDIILRMMIIGGLFIGLGVWFYWGLKSKCQKNYAVAPILFSINGLLYCISAEFGLLSKNTFVIWGDLVSLHGVIILITTGIILIQCIGGKEEWTQH